MDFDVEAIKSNPNYIVKRMMHQGTFREVFTEAFSHSDEGQIMLTSALFKISSRDFKGGLNILEQLEPLCATEQDEVSLCYFKGLAYDFLEDEEKMEENYERFLEQNTVIEPVYMYFPYIRRAKLLHKACKNMKSYEYFRKMQSYFEERGRENENNLSLCNLYFDLANSLMFCHNYKDALDYIERAHQVWKNDTDDGHKMVEMMVFVLTENEDKAKNVLETIDKKSKVYNFADQIFQKLLNKEEPHYFIIEPSQEKIEKFWDWFLKNEKKLRKIALGDNYQELQMLLSKKLRKVFDYMQRELAFSLEIDGEKITVVAYTDYVASLDYGYERLFENAPEKLTNWEFIITEEMSNYD